MKTHSGMRPQDIVVLLKIVSKKNSPWLMKELASELMISPSEISESINRSMIAGLISQDKQTVNKLSLLDFLRYGFRYVYPQWPGGLTRGFPTAHSAPPLNDLILSVEIYVWPHENGKVRGQAIGPLYPKLPDACVNNPEFYQYMSLLDAIRTGKTRERRIAFELLTKKIDNVEEPND